MVATIVTLNVPVLVGVPESVAVDVENESHEGKLLAEKVVVVALPPVVAVMV